MKKKGSAVGTSRSAATKKKIRRSALKVFAKNGFEGSSLRQIARDANVTDALIHYHFGGKEKLWREVASELYDKMHIRSDADLRESDGVDELTEMAVRTRSLMEFLLENPDLHALIAPELQNHSPRTDFLISNFYKPRFFTALKGISKAQEMGELPPGPPVLLNIIVISLAAVLVQRAGEIECLTGRSVHDKALQEEFWAQIEWLIFRPARDRK
ncbi:TetR/AcrR family transcriptional regulator [Sphingobium sp. Sx8-8]|uniref:TetR/AcrR family transcriptional regulator n=1 Tax=Sphingobium sp. Sx8-8 TaxID=2933617 RepID=UPI001F5ABB28